MAPYYGIHYIAVGGKTYFYEKCTHKPIYSFRKTCQEQELLLWLKAGCINALYEAVKLQLVLSLYDLHKSCSVHTL